jgi:sarcosine oxidase
VARTADVVVIGAGIAGAATARALARSGRTVVVVERFDVGHTRGSSHGATRIFRLGYPDERYVRMAQTALSGWRELEQECGDSLLVRTGAVDIGAEAGAVARALSACGVRFEELTPTEAHRRFGIAVGSDERTLFQADGGSTRSDRALVAFLGGAREAGAELVERTTVLELRVEPRHVHVETDGVPLRARAVVVTAGAWAPGLLAPLGIDLHVVPTRETVAYVDLQRAATLPSLIDYASASTAGAEGLGRSGVAGFALSAPERGLKAGLHHAGAATDPDDDPPPDGAIAEWATRWARRRIPDAGDLLGAETCIYTNTADESFVLERHGRVVVGSACSGHGFKFAPLIGRTLAALAGEAAR